MSEAYIKGLREELRKIKDGVNQECQTKAGILAFFDICIDDLVAIEGSEIHSLVRGIMLADPDGCYSVFLGPRSNSSTFLYYLGLESSEIVGALPGLMVYELSDPEKIDKYLIDRKPFLSE